MRQVKQAKVITLPDGTKVFEYYDLLSWMERIGRKKEFLDWFHGQTGKMVKDRYYVFYDDVARFLRGAPSMVT